MVINRLNYEEYFLLYIDGELPVSERQAVELFVAQNADLAGELELLLQTRLECDITALPDKNSLYRHTGCKINETNYEELFLLYVDNELKEEDKKEVAIFLLQNPDKQQHFAALMGTKLVPEQIVYKNKESLYRKKKPAILYFSWARVAVAAAFLGLLVTTFNFLPSKITRVKNTMVAHPGGPKMQNSIPTIAVTDSTTKQPVAITTAFSKNTVRNTGRDSKVNKLLKKEIAPSLPIPNDFISSQNENKKGKDIKEKETTIAIIQPGNITGDKLEIGMMNPKQLPAVSNSADNDSKTLLQKTVYKELDTDDANNKINIYIGNLQINKYKLAGLLKKAGHIFSKAPDSENSIAIANFTINKSLR